MLPCDNYRGFRDPLGNVASLCDALLTCWLASYATQSEYDDCVTAANDGISVCNDDCAPEDDGSAAAAAKESCDTACNTTADDCASGCQSDFDACVGGDDCGIGTDCYSACLAGKIDCDQGCHDAQQGCRSTCYLNYQIAIAGLAPGDANCAAACCSSKPEHIAVCKGPCNHAYDTAATDANVAYWSCVSGCELVFWDNGDTFIYNSDCVDGCDLTRQAALGEAANTKALCIFDCQADYNNQWIDCGSNYRCDRQCLSDNQDAVLLCTLASLGGADQSTYAHCLNDAATALARCNLDCCFNLQGRNAFDAAAIDCVVTKSDCLTDIIDSCPAPGTGTGDPCEHPASDDCAAATAAQTACIDAATLVCNTAFKDCIQGIGAKNLAACGGCLGDFLFPDT